MKWSIRILTDVLAVILGFMILPIQTGAASKVKINKTSVTVFFTG